jgi:hypothetical protein
VACGAGERGGQRHDAAGPGAKGLIDVAIWVQADEAETERRNLARVGTPNGSATVQDHLDWMAEEIPFLADQRPWERVDLVVCGTQLIVFDSATELVVAPPSAEQGRAEVTRGG